MFKFLSLVEIDAMVLENVFEGQQWMFAESLSNFTELIDWLDSVLRRIGNILAI